VIDLGCGKLGGFVPALLSTGYDAVGVNPEAPEDPGFHQGEFRISRSLSRSTSATSTVATPRGAGRYRADE
jgi:hypothetical protein